MKKNVLLVDITTIREGLADFFMSLIQNDPKEIRRLILSDGLESLIVNVGKLSDKDAVSLYAELCVGVELAEKEGVDTIYFEEPCGDLVFLADVKQGKLPLPTVKSLKNDGGLAILQKSGDKGHILTDEDYNTLSQIQKTA